MNINILPADDRLLRIKEAAEFLRVSDKTVRRLIDDGKLLSIKIRGLRLIQVSAIKELIEKAKA